MKIFFVSALLFASASTSLAMPCDTGYKCTSKSGKYKIEVQRCRYVNRLGNLSSVKIDNKEVKGAELTAAFDGKSIGDSLLAFEIAIPNDEEYSKTLVVEIPANTSRGTIKERLTDDTDSQVTHSEKISCVVEE